MNRKILLEALFIFFIGFFIYSINDWGLYIYSLDEAKNSECAREMLERGDLIVPTFNYELRTDKPPLHYYFMILGYKLFGVNEFAARFFSSVFGGLLVLITYFFAKRYYGIYVAFFSFLALISSLHMAVQFHMAVPDPYLIFWINASLFSFYVWYKERKEIFLYLFYLFSGLGVLTKGPVAVVLPFFIVFAFLFFTRNIYLLKNMKIFQGIFIISLVSLPWYVAVWIKTDGVWVKEFIFKHNIHRFSAPMEGHGGIFLLTFVYIFIGMLPFSVFLPQALVKAYKEKFEDINLFLLLFLGIYTVFFAISKTKLPNYTVPVYPSIAILTGAYLFSLKEKIPKSVIWSLISFVAISLLVIVGLYLGIKNEKEISDLAYLSSFFIIWTIGGIVSLFFIKKDKILSILSLSIFSILLSLLFFSYIYPKVDKRNPVAQIMPLIEKDKKVFYYRRFNPAFVFYIRKKIPPISKKRIKSVLYSKKKIYILTRKKYEKDITKYKRAVVLKEVKDLFENKVSVLITNRIKRSKK